MNRIERRKESVPGIGAERWTDKLASFAFALLIIWAANFVADYCRRADFSATTGAVAHTVKESVADFSAWWGAQ